MSSLRKQLVPLQRCHASRVQCQTRAAHSLIIHFGLTLVYRFSSIARVLLYLQNEHCCEVRSVGRKPSGPRPRGPVWASRLGRVGPMGLELLASSSRGLAGFCQRNLKVFMFAEHLREVEWWVRRKKRKREGKRRTTRGGGALVISRTLLTIYTHLFNKVNEISVRFRVFGGDGSCSLEIKLKEN